MSQITANPLSKHFRQPKIYLRLPSGGNFYPRGTINLPASGEIPIYAMTAKDELTIKTPDALLNGQSTVDVIKSCAPNIIDPWAMPTLDVDAVLIAIRIATYGEKMDIDTKVPVTGTERTYDLDLRTVLDNLNSNEYSNIFSINDFKVEIAPLNYRQFTDMAMKTFEEQRVFTILNNNEMSDNEKLARFNESFTKLTDINIGIVSQSIVAIQFQDEQPVTNPAHIKEFIDNCDKDFFKGVLTHVNAEKEKFSIKPLTITTEQEDREKGAPEQYTVPISFDSAHFFV